MDGKIPRRLGGESASSYGLDVSSGFIRPPARQEDVFFSSEIRNRHEFTGPSLCSHAVGQTIEPTSNPLEKADFTLASSMNLRRHSEALMRLDAAARIRGPVSGSRRKPDLISRTCQISTPISDWAAAVTPSLLGGDACRDPHTFSQNGPSAATRAKTAGSVPQVSKVF